MIHRADNNNERQASLKAHREKHGLTLVRVWVALADADKLRRYAWNLPQTEAARAKANRVSRKPKGKANR